MNGAELAAHLRMVVQELADGRIRARARSRREDVADAVIVIVLLELCLRAGQCKRQHTHDAARELCVRGAGTTVGS